MPIWMCFQDFPGKKLPPQRDYDHAINLSETYEPQRSSPYSLSPAQQGALDDFLEENLAKGFIRLSKSPQAAPLFFCAKEKQQATSMHGLSVFELAYSSKFLPTTTNGQPLEQNWQGKSVYKTGPMKWLLQHSYEERQQSKSSLYHS